MSSNQAKQTQHMPQYAMFPKCWFSRFKEQLVLANVIGQKRDVVSSIHHILTYCQKNVNLVNIQGGLSMGKLVLL